MKIPLYYFLVETFFFACKATNQRQKRKSIFLKMNTIYKLF